MVPCKIQTLSFNHLVRKFSANVQPPRTFWFIARKSSETAFTENFPTRKSHEKARISGDVGDPISGNQSSVSKDILVKSEFYMHFINILNLKLRNSIFL